MFVRELGNLSLRRIGADITYGRTPPPAGGSAISLGRSAVLGELSYLPPESSARTIDLESSCSALVPTTNNNATQEEINNK